MKLLLRQSTTQLDYAVARPWTVDVRSAFDFGDLERAIKTR